MMHGPLELRLGHDVQAGGHPGVDRIKARLKDHFCWYGMLRNVENYVEPEEGELFFANPAVKNNHINRNLFVLDDHKVLWRRGETAFGGPPGSQAGRLQAVMT